MRGFLRQKGVMLSFGRLLQHQTYASTHTATPPNISDTSYIPTAGNTARGEAMSYKSVHKGSSNSGVLQGRADTSATTTNTTTTTTTTTTATASGSSNNNNNGNNTTRSDGNTTAAGSERRNRVDFMGSRSSCAEDAGVVPNRPLSPLQRRQLLYKHKAAFALTPRALYRVKYLLSQSSGKQDGQTQQQAPDGIRIGVRRRGCSGYSYTVNYHYPEGETGTGTRETAVGNGVNGSTSKDVAAGRGMKDVVVEQDGVKVVVDSDALFYVIGTEMDYVVRNVEEKFTFRNPNQKYSCGCEESFMPFDIDEQA